MDGYLLLKVGQIIDLQGFSEPVDNEPYVI
jgi:hypothetical protein